MEVAYPCAFGICKGRSAPLQRSHPDRNGRLFLPFAPRERRPRSGGTVATGQPHRIHRNHHCFFRSPPPLCPTLCADTNAPFRPRQPRCIFHPPGTASPSCRSSPLPPNEISSPDSVPVPANLFHRIENPPVSVFASPSLEPESSYLQALPSSCFRQAIADRQ